MQHNSLLRMDTMRFQKHIDTLTSGQKVFVDLLQDWIREPRNILVIVSGGPGTGKTHTVTKTLDCVQCRQLRMAPTAHVAGKIGGRTIHSALGLNWHDGSLLRNLEKELQDETDVYKCIKKSERFRAEISYPGYHPIVVIDEICMVPGWMAYWIVDRLFSNRSPNKPVLFIVMGDSHQLRPVKSNENLFDISFSQESFETRRINLTESKRFTPEYESVIQRLRSFVDKSDEIGLFAYICQNFPIVEDIHCDILRQCDRALAFTNATVAKYNENYLKMIPGNAVTRLVQIDSRKKETKENYVDVKPNCLVFVTQNGCSLASNGTLLRFQRYDQNRDAIKCMSKEGFLLEVKRNFEGKFPIVLGFASTIHKFQGETIDENQIAINFEGNRDLNFIYTALSRVKSMDQIKAVCMGGAE